MHPERTADIPADKYTLRSYESLVAKGLATRNSYGFRETPAGFELAKRISTAPGDIRTEVIRMRIGRQTKAQGVFREFIEFFGGVDKTAEALGISYKTLHRIFVTREDLPNKSLMLLTDQLARKYGLKSPFPVCQTCLGSRQAVDEAGILVACPDCSTTTDAN